MNESATLDRGQEYVVRESERVRAEKRIRVLEQQAQAYNDLAAGLRREVRLLKEEAGIDNRSS